MTRTRDRTLLIAVIACAGLMYLTMLPRFLERLDPLTGDEPFYVMTAISMVRDHDLDETNNYVNRDYDEFYPAGIGPDWQGWPAFPTTLPPHAAHTHLGGLHTKHGLGLSFLIAVPYEIAGRVGADLIPLLCGALLAGQMYLLGREAGAQAPLAAVIALGLSSTLPIAPYALLIFPEVPAALLLLYATRRLSAADSTVVQWFMAGAAVGFLPWLHQRFAPTAALLALLYLVRIFRSHRRRALIPGLIPLVILGLALLGYNLWMYHSPFQSVADHAGFSGPTGTVNGFFGLLLDAQWGLLIAAPVYLLAFVAIPMWWSRARATALVALAAILPYVLVIASYRVWWGEWGPPARYLVPIVPLAAGPLCAWLSRASFPAKAATASVWLLGFALSLIGDADPQRLYHQPTGFNNLIGRADEILHTHIASRLIAFQPYAVAPTAERAGAVGVLLVLTWTVVFLMYYVHALSGKSHSAQRGSESAERRI
jgi:hypothetical protein